MIKEKYEIYFEESLSHKSISFLIIIKYMLTDKFSKNLWNIGNYIKINFQYYQF